MAHEGVSTRNTTNFRGDNGFLAPVEESIPRNGLRDNYLKSKACSTCNKLLNNDGLDYMLRGETFHFIHKEFHFIAD